MKRFFKRLFLLLFLAFAGLVGYGFYKGMTVEQMQAQAVAWYDEYKPDFGGAEGEEAISEEDSGSDRPSSIKTDRPKSKAEAPIASATQKLLPLPRNPFAKIDRHARKASSSEEKSIPSLAAYLTKSTSSDLEKARAIYVWLTANISYDDKGYNSKNYSPTDAESVLQNRIGVCGGFANLYLALGQEAGLIIKKVSGYAKGYSYSVGDRFTKVDHAWNLIQINGQWRIFDATWGEGNGNTVNGKLKSTKEFDEVWFNADPYLAIFSHMPENPQQAYVSPSLTLSNYEKLPKVDKSYLASGFDAKLTYQKALKNPRLQFPSCYETNTYSEVKTAPRSRFLEMGVPYTFKLYVPRGIAVAAIDANDNFTYFEREKGYFSASITPSIKGKLSISIQSEKTGNSFWSYLIYEVKKRKVNS